MRTSTSSTLLASALAALALIGTGCRTTSDPQPTICSRAAQGASCTTGADCCSGSCYVATGNAAGMCIANPCAGPAAGCGAASDCCNASCDPASHVCNIGPCTLGQPGDSCQYPQDCCSGSCEGAIGAKVCTSGGGGGCHLLQDGCVGATAAEKNASCCTGYCNASNACDTPPTSCLDDAASCSGDLQCCSKKCTGGGTCAPVADSCAYEGEACGSSAQCCTRLCPNAGSAGATCSSTPCLQVGEPCSPANDLCCSGSCDGTTHRCVAPPPGGTGQTCATLNEACAYPSDCCSKNCQGASGGLKNGACMPVSGCNAFGDICYRAEDCCSGLCSNEPGKAGRCDDASGGCGQDGTPCATDSQCCTRKCADLGTGATACKPAGGCRMTGDYCDRTASCCGGTNETDPNLPNPYGVFCDGIGTSPGPTEWDTRTQDDRTCTGGQSCNPPGNICGYKASQNCCYEGGGSGKAVCKPDANGILRCFGCAVTSDCPTGCDPDRPLCCKQPGDVCQFRDQCCGRAPCSPDPSGVLRCAGSCLPAGSICAASSATVAPDPDPCCSGATCQYVTEVGWACATAGGSCARQGAACDGGTPCCFGPCTNGTCEADCAPTGSCSTDAQCCSGVCDPTSHLCRTSCIAGGGGCTDTSDCCTGLTCEVPPGATGGTCRTGSDCASTGQSCGGTVTCCLPSDTCTDGVCKAPVSSCSSAAQACQATADCCPNLELACLMMGPDEVSEIACAPGGTCYCGVACATRDAACSTIVPCCGTDATYCGSDADGAPCASADKTQCSCKPIG